MTKTHGKDYEEFGKRIAELREQKGLSQSEISELLGIPQSTYAGYELGNRKVPLSIIKKLSKIYGVSADYLLGNQNEKQSTTSQSTTIAAHFEGELTPEEQEEINNFIQYVLSKRKK